MTEEVTVPARSQSGTPDALFNADAPAFRSMTELQVGRQVNYVVDASDTAGFAPSIGM